MSVRKSASFPCGRYDLSLQDIVRRHALIIGMPLRVLAVNQHAVPIAGTRIELQIFLAERLCDHIEQHAAVLGFNVTGGMVAHDKVFIAVMPRRIDGHKIHAERDIVRLHVDADGRCLQR